MSEGRAHYPTVVRKTSNLRQFYYDIKFLKWRNSHNGHMTIFFEDNRFNIFFFTKVVKGTIKNCLMSAKRVLNLLKSDCSVQLMVMVSHSTVKNFFLSPDTELFSRGMFEK